MAALAISDWAIGAGSTERLTSESVRAREILPHYSNFLLSFNGISQRAADKRGQLIK